MGKKKSTPWNRWLEAAKVLGPHPDEPVICSQNADDFLVVFDMIWRGERFDRYMICPACKSRNVVSGLISTEKTQAKHTFDNEDYTYSVDDILRLIMSDRESLPDR